MYIARFDTGVHLPILHDWMARREAYQPPGEEMPALGYILYDGFTPVATAFLRRVEGGYAQLDGLATNPECHSALRDQALDTLVAYVLAEAKHHNIRAVTATSVDKNTLLRSQRHGFIALPHVCIICDLSKGN